MYLLFYTEQYQTPDLLGYFPTFDAMKAWALEHAGTDSEIVWPTSETKDEYEYIYVDPTHPKAGRFNMAYQKVFG